MSDYILSSNNCYKEVNFGQNFAENSCSQYQDNAILYQQNNNERGDWHLDNCSSDKSTTGYGNNLCQEELEMILETQKQILSIARQNALKVKESCGISQRLHNHQRVRNAVTTENVNQQFKAGELPRAGINGIECCDDVIESNNTIAVDICCVESAVSDICPTEVQVSKPVHNFKTTPGMYRTHTRLQQHSIQDKEKANEKVLQRKAAHNKIERRRRSFINYKIAELQSLLPKDMSHTAGTNKGSILKESVDYIRKLQGEFSIINELNEKANEIDTERKRFAMRLEILEMRTAANVENRVGSDQNIVQVYEEPKNQRSDSIVDTYLPEVLPVLSKTIDFDKVFNV